MTTLERRPFLRRRTTYLVGVPLLLGLGALLLVVVAPYVYIHYIEGPAPAELAFEPAAAGSRSAAPVRLDGTWRVAPGSQAGYRVDETLFGQGTTAVGRTEAIRGRFVLDGTTVRSGAFTVDLREVSSDREARDQQFQDRIMATADFPTATFRLVAPFTLRRLPADLTTVRVSAPRPPDAAREDATADRRAHHPSQWCARRGPGIDPGRLRRLRHPQPELRPGPDRRPRHDRVPPGVRPRRLRHALRAATSASAAVNAEL